MIPPGYRIERGLLWPESDVGAAAAVFEMAGDLDAVYPYCRGFKVAVQAGGNCGVWPAAMGQAFDTVYSFEPDPTNFRCLCANAPAENIFKFNAALGNAHRGVDLVRYPHNVGAHYVEPDKRGPIPMLCIDDLALQACDLIYLDIEGYELKALYGGIQTIRAHWPVVVIEDKGLSEKYGTAKGMVEVRLADFGYQVKARLNRDIVFVPPC